MGRISEEQKNGLQKVFLDNMDSEPFYSSREDLKVRN